MNIVIVMIFILFPVTAKILQLTQKFNTDGLALAKGKATLDYNQEYIKKGEH